MQLLHANAAYSRRLDQGDYVARRLSRARLADLLATVTAATDLVEAKGHAWDRARRKAFATQADRDAVDDELDGLAKDHRAHLAGRSANAARSEPYTLIYHRGIDYYVVAPVDQQVTRYQELAGRLRAHLPAEEAEPLAARIEALLAEYEVAEKALARARRALALAATALAAAESAFDLTLERVHGALTAKLDRRAADRFFPRYAARSAAGATGGTTDEGAPEVLDA